MNNKAFTMLEIIVALFICSLIFIFILPNLMREYNALMSIEKSLEMKQLLYQELVNNEGEDFSIEINNYKIVRQGSDASIEDYESGRKLVYEQ